MSALRSGTTRSFGRGARSRLSRTRSEARGRGQALTNVGTWRSALGASAFGLLVAYAPVAQAKEEEANLEQVRGMIQQVIEDDPDMGPTLVRLAWHASGTYDRTTGTGGSNGATMRHVPESDFGANAGLHLARNVLEPIKKAHPTMSYADLWTYAGCVAVEEMDGPKIVWRPGRIDKGPEFCPPDGRLPDGEKGGPAGTAQHVRDIFYRMGFNDREIVALVGAHALGECHTDRSGYSGPWTRMKTTFSNEYFRELLENTWTLKKWKGPAQFEDPTGELMMLPADMALVWDADFRKYVEMYAKDQDLWFSDFAKAFQKLEELGCNLDRPWWKIL